jgi:hypothetical protein
MRSTIFTFLFKSWSWLCTKKGFFTIPEQANEITDSVHLQVLKPFPVQRKNKKQGKKDS